MIKTVRLSFIVGSTKAPPSKSMAQRLIAAALLAEGTSEITCQPLCNDSKAAIAIAKTLGAEITIVKDKITIKGGLKQALGSLDCGESGLCARMFSPIAALLDGTTVISGHGSLAKRLLDIPSEISGASFTATQGHLPVTIKGSLRGGGIEIDGSAGSQFITGLLMALPLAPNDSILTVNSLKSKPYIEMTLKVLSDSGIIVTHEDFQKFIIPGRQKYMARNCTVEGDWSGSAFLLVAGALTGFAELTNLDETSTQADKKILDALRLAGADIKITGSTVAVRKQALRAFSFDATDCPDLFPPLAALAAYCDGTSKIKGAGRLKNKESDRAAVLEEEFAKLGVIIETDGDIMSVHGRKAKPSYNMITIDPHNDHRIAMAAAIAGTLYPGKINIENAECVNKSYPGFYDDLVTIGGIVT